MSSPSVSPKATTPEPVSPEPTKSPSPQPEPVIEDPHESLEQPIEAVEKEESEEQAEEEEEEDEEELETLEDLESVKEDQICQVCAGKFRQPRVLSCLHVFCQPCLEEQLKGDELEDEGLEEAETEEDGKEHLSRDGQNKAMDKPPLDCIKCPLCQQETSLGGKGVADLAHDLVMVNMLDMAAIEVMQIVCTSCKAREKAVARCADCINFLCPNCVTAHQFMRCFENHKVVSFEELKDGQGMALHKPVFCENHPNETVKFFCNNCQDVICSDCTEIHKAHQVDRIADIEDRQIEEVKALIAENQGKVSFCREAASKLENSQQELQMQRENARGLIQETFQTYKTILEKKQEEVLHKLAELHSEKRTYLWEMTHNVEKMMERIEDGCLFADRVIKNGSGPEVLKMKKLISTQLLSLINNSPNPDVSVKMEFVTDEEKFRQALDATFGMIDTIEKNPLLMTDHVAALDIKLSEEIGSLGLTGLDGEGFVLPPGVLSPDGVMPPVTTCELPFNLHHGLPPLSIPNIPSLSSGVTGVVADTINSMTSMPNLSSDKSSSRNSYSPAMSDSGISVDAGSTGQITLNGQVIPGLNVNNVTGLPHAITNRVGTPTSSDAALTSLLNSLGSGSTGGTSSGSSIRSQTPQLTSQFNDITGLLNQANQQLNGLSGLSGGSGALGSSGSLTSTTMTSSSGSLLTQPLSPINTAMPINGGAMNMHTPPPSTPTINFGVGQPSFARTSSNKMGAMQIRCKFGQLGPGKGQFNSPHGFCLGLDEDIVVADTNNHRIQVFEKTGEFKYQFGIPGREEGQLWYPRKVAVIRHSGKYVVCDRGNERSRMQIFTKNGHFIKKIAIRYIDIVAGLAITSQGHIVAVDSVSPTVFCIAETGDLIKWFDCSDYMREPSDIAISGKEYFVCDFKGHCVVVFSEDGQFLRRIGCENITNFPNGIDISDAGDVLVGDSHGNRFHVAVFQREGSLIGEFECPYVKVSRCCGLKITSEGYIVTLAKNNHHVLVLNTLYIT